MNNGYPFTDLGEGYHADLGRGANAYFPKRVLDNLPKPVQREIETIIERFHYNMARTDARFILQNLKTQIKKTGGERQRSEGLPLIRRVIKRLQPWVD